MIPVVRFDFNLLADENTIFVNDVPVWAGDDVDGAALEQLAKALGAAYVESYNGELQ